MANQPFYHRATILFTAKREITADQLKNAIRNTPELSDALRGLIRNTIEVEEIEVEAGDPADL